MKINVYGVGNALVDLQVQLSDEILARTGFEKGIMTLVDDDQQREVLEEISQLPRNQCSGARLLTVVRSARTRWGISSWPRCADWG